MNSTPSMLSMMLHCKKKRPRIEDRPRYVHVFIRYNLSVITKRRLRLFRHLARAVPSQDHLRILRAAINRPPADWRRRAGRPRRIWLRTIELYLRPHNIGLNTAWMRVQNRSKWRQLVEKAVFTEGRATR